MEHSEHGRSALVIRAADCDVGSLGGIGVRFILDGAEADGRFSVVEHPLPPHALGAPLHRHSREDEYSFVVEGQMGALLGDRVVNAAAGDLVFKPRGQWHTFWNPGDKPARVLEIISPAGFERYFAELVEMQGVAEMRAFEIEPEAFAALCNRYGLQMRPETVPELIERFGLAVGG